MPEPIRTALLAAAEEDVCGVIPAMLASAGVSLLTSARDGASAMDAVSQHRPDLLVADVHLPVLDGPSLTRRVLDGSNLPVRPSVMLLYRREFPVPNRAKLEEMGAVFLPWPARRDTFCAAVEALQTTRCRFPRVRMLRADQLLDALGFSEHAGRDCLRLAALLCAGDERLLHGRRVRLYPMLGEMLGLRSTGVERLMRHAIGAAWQSDKFDNQYRIFADTVDAGRGQPTCGEMIARLADILRLEG